MVTLFAIITFTTIALLNEVGKLDHAHEAAMAEVDL